ncbi:histidinol-phosphate transaminase [Phytohalomonas tamaricis]|uniref:histidinol-phosphate transaminase n=1 Tax=Phytohalomonas tamaricis TaxID=2081032 RepID=UPI000D0B7383|nr:histidinol-phosphate transaminase [Phytohalomonas tamaricis]
MSKFWSPSVQELKPYIPGEQPRTRLIKLNTNENPYPPAPGVERVLREYPIDHLRLYPDPDASALRDALAREYNVQPEQVFLGNGSDEVLAFAFQAFFRHDKPLLMPEITYSFYPVYCQLYAIEAQRVALDDQWRVQLDAFDSDNGGIIFANPNAPTGHGYSRAAIAELLSHHTERVVLVDEAYADFGGESAVGLVDTCPNLLVTGTFSKSRSLAGLRIGYAIGSRELIEGLDRVKNSFNSYPLDSLAIAAGVAALEDRAHFKACCEAVITTRERTRRGLEQLDFEVLPSQANFLFVRPRSMSALEVFSELRERGILVRHFNTDILHDFLRISIGTDDEMDTLLETLDTLINVTPH